MDTSAHNPGERVVGVSFTADAICVELRDGRTVSAPLNWFPKLYAATSEQQADWQISGGGFGIHWPAIDEDISVEGLLRGAPAPGSTSPAKSL